MHPLLSQKSSVHYSTQTVEHEVLRWFELHPITLEAESEDEDEGEAAGEVGDGGSEDSKT